MFNMRTMLCVILVYTMFQNAAFSEKVLMPHDLSASDKFGSDIAVDGDVVLVGALGDNITYPGAVYIFERHARGTNTWDEVVKLTASDAYLYDYYGWAVALAGDVALIGAPYADKDGTNNTGRAYIYERNAEGINTWTEVAVLQCPEADLGDSFGYAVAVDCDTAVIGAQGDDTAAGNGAGSVFVFERNAGGTNAWGLVTRLIASDGAANDNFGDKVAIDGDIIAVGVQKTDNYSGSVYVFERNQGGTNTWEQVAKLAPDVVGEADRFGSDVSIDGDVMLIGASLDDDMGDGAGAAYIFQRGTGGTNLWNQTAKLTALDGASADSFGNSVALDGDTALVGAYAQDVVGMTSGSAYIFERHAGGKNNWGQTRKLIPETYYSSGDNFGKQVALNGNVAAFGVEYDDTFGNSAGLAYLLSVCDVPENFEEAAKLTDPNGSTNDTFGYAVSVDGATAVIGTPNDSSAGTGAGAAHVFVRGGDGMNQWEWVADLSPSNLVANDWFGFSVAVDGGTALIGAAADDDTGSQSGAAYIFDRQSGSTNVWNEVSQLTASDGSAGAKYGDSVALYGNMALVGASYDDPLWNAPGAAYIYERNRGGTNAWGEVKKLTAPDGSASNWFGGAVAINGDVALAGAYGFNDAGNNAGAAYLYERNAGGTNAWGFTRKLTASDGVAGDRFGTSLAIEGDTVVVGAPYHDSGAAYVYERNIGGTNFWGEVVKLTASDAGLADYFGQAVDVAGNIIMVSANRHNARGAAYVFWRNAGGTNQWGQIGKIEVAELDPGDEFGFSMALEGSVAVLGAYGDDDIGNQSGAAYIFEYVEPMPQYEMTDFEMSGNEISFSWTSSVPYDYTVQASSSFDGDAAWSNIANFADQPGSNIQMSVTNPISGADARYYRVLATPSPVR